MKIRAVASAILLVAACTAPPAPVEPVEPAAAAPQDPQPVTATPDTGGRKIDDALADATNRGDSDAVRALLELAASTPSEQEVEYESDHLGRLRLLPTVFPPQEAELYVLPFVDDHADFFRGKTVLEIGTGSGIISLYIAKLGAKKVVATDINPWAIESLHRNAERLGLRDRVEGRLVTADDMSAYAVIGDRERFDILISNPPYSLDLDSKINTPEIDKGDLGFSLLRGLDQHLTENGVAVLFYNSLFYHLLMVKLAREWGWDTRSHSALSLAPWEIEPLFNTYLRRVFAHEGLPDDLFRFDDVADMLPYTLTIEKREFVPQAIPLLDGYDSGKVYRGFFTLKRQG